MKDLGALGLWGTAAVVALVAFVAACTWQPPATSRSEDDTTIHGAALPREPIPSSASADSPSPPHAQIVELSLNEAIKSAVDALFAGNHSSPLSAFERRAVVINPLVQDKAGSQNNATREVQSSIDRLIRIKYHKFNVLPFTVANLGKEPLVVIGTLAATDKEGRPEVEKETYRLWLSLADLRSEKIVAKAQAYVKRDDIDLTPTPHFRDSPVWTYCPLTEGYISTCQETIVGDAIKRGYLERIAAEPVIIEAMEAYNAGRYEDSLALYGSLMGTTQADQPRVYNGVYLANWKLGRRDAMAKAFGRIVEYGMAHGQLAVCFLFSPGSTGFWPNPEVSGPYEMWLEQIAERASRSTSCLEIVGHTSPTGPEPLNERLSLARAERIKGLLMAEAPDLKRTTFATGVGSRENIIGTATDDARDALDRRVSFKVFSCAPKAPSN